MTFYIKYCVKNGEQQFRCSSTMIKDNNTKPAQENLLYEFQNSMTITKKQVLSYLFRQKVGKVLLISTVASLLIALTGRLESLLVPLGLAVYVWEVLRNYSVSIQLLQIVHDGTMHIFLSDESSYMAKKNNWFVKVHKGGSNKTWGDTLEVFVDGKIVVRQASVMGFPVEQMSAVAKIRQSTQ
jgi:hypothetical protein